MMPSAAESREVAESHYKAGRLDQALAVTGTALEHHPDDGTLWEIRGLAMHALKQFAAARDAFEQAALLKPLSYFAQVGLGSCYLATNKVDLARLIYRHVAAQPGIPSTLLAALAAGLRHVDEAELAMEVHRERVRRDPDDEQAVFALAHSMQQVGEPPEKVLPLLRRAFALAPDHPVYRVGLALMLAQRGDTQGAYQLASELPVADLISGCCPCRLRGLALLFRRAGDEARARACERQAFKKLRPGGCPDGSGEASNQGGL